MFSDFYLPVLRCSVTHHTEGILAARAIKNDHYPLIILPIRVVPGLELEEARDLPELKKIWARGTDQEERYFGIALQLARYAREEGPNKRSLIIFADTFEDENDGLIPRVQGKVLEAGADAYIDMSRYEPRPRRAFFSLIEQRLGWGVPKPEFK